MKFSYETNRLILQLLEPDDASMVLNFQLNNISFFEKYEATRPANFYTLEFQRKTLEAEYQLALRASMIRYYVFRKEDLRRIIGTVCFRDIRLSSFFSCETGYKFDHSYWHQGYAQESMEKAIDVMFFEQNMHRIEASVMPEISPPSVCWKLWALYRRALPGKARWYAANGRITYAMPSFIHNAAPVAKLIPVTLFCQKHRKTENRCQNFFLSPPHAGHTQNELPAIF
ncbi:MAG: GNAT family N-acetyltransferase [Lachnospiraceae bacterium]|nr:GNAT family N-acetyltransferase [Lachnospiraceae bacterium]